MKKVIELTPRLRQVADLVPAGARLTDVGTDHAYLPAALVLEEKIPSAIAADLRPGPLDRAKATVREYGLANQIGFRLCDGLSGIRPEDFADREEEGILLVPRAGEMLYRLKSAK